LVDDPGRAREFAGVACVIEMKMRERDIADIGRRDTYRLELIDQRCLLTQMQRPVFDIDAILGRGDLIPESGIPQQNALRVADQEARRSEIAGFAVVFTGVRKWCQILKLEEAAVDGI